MFESKIIGGKAHALVGMAVWIVVCIAVLGLSACGDADLTDMQYVQRAKDAQDQGDLRTSVIELKNALKQNPDNPEARWLLGKIQVDTGNGPAAEKELMRASELGIPKEVILVPLGKSLLLQREFSRLLNEIQVSEHLQAEDRAWIHALRGKAYLATNESSQASEEFNAALKIYPNSIAALVGHARLAMAQHKPEQARTWIDRAHAIEAESAEVWEALGDLERSQFRVKEAEIAYTHAIENSFNTLAVRLNRALTRIHLKDNQGAAKDIEIVKKAAPEHFAGHYVHGLLYFQLKQYSDAQIEFEKALNLVQEYIPAEFYLGVSHFLQEHWQQAEQFLARVLYTYPSSSRVRKLLGAVRLQLGDYAGAEAVLQTLLDRNPNDVQALSLIGRAYVKRGKASEAIEYFRKAVALQPDIATRRIQLALGHLMEGGTDVGISELETTIELAPELQEVDMLLVLAYIHTRQFDHALQAAERFKLKQPDSYVAFNLVGLVYKEQGNVSAAREAFQQALKLEPGEPGASSYLAVMDVENGDYDKAKAHYLEVIRRHPGHLSTLLQLAMLDGRLGHVDDFRDWLSKAVEANPQAIEPRLLLARYYLRFGQPQRALATIAEVRDVYPNLPRLLSIAGEAQLANGELSSASATFKQLIEVQPESADAHYLLAQVYREQKDRVNFLGELKKALKLKPDHLQSKVAMARLLSLEQNRKEANRLLGELKKSSKDNPQVLELEAWLASRQNRLQDAISIYQQLLSSFPSSEMVTNLANVYGQAGDFDANLRTLEEWLDKNPNDVKVRYHLANVYLFIGRQEAARDQFAKVVKDVPDNVPALNNLGWLWREDDPVKALAYAEHAYELAPTSVSVMDTLGVVLLDLDQTERAVRLLRKASEQVPDAVTIRYHFAKALAHNGDKTTALRLLKDLLAKEIPFAEQEQARALLKELDN